MKGKGRMNTHLPDTGGESTIIGIMLTTKNRWRRVGKLLFSGECLVWQRFWVRTGTLPSPTAWACLSADACRAAGCAFVWRALRKRTMMPSSGVWRRVGADVLCMVLYEWHRRDGEIMPIMVLPALVCGRVAGAWQSARLNFPGSCFLGAAISVIPRARATLLMAFQSHDFLRRALSSVKAHLGYAFTNSVMVAKDTCRRYS